MSLKVDAPLSPDQSIETNLQSGKKLQYAYTREFLLSLSELDACKKLPQGFHPSLLSEFEDASQDRQRQSGNFPPHTFRRNDFGSPPLTRGELGSYSRGNQGRWDRRPSGRSERDTDSQSDLDSDSGRSFGNQSRRSWQVPEHDGLLGSGSFPRPSGYGAGKSAPRFQSNDQNHLSKTSEPYQLPRPYKTGPYSRRETTDSLNDETFGSSESANDDRAEEERKRRDSFEMMRKEQQKAFQEKRNLNPEKRKEGFDITELVEESKEDNVISKKITGADEPGVLLASDKDSQKASLPPQTFAPRPLVPPGFTSAILERNSLTKLPVHSHSLEAGNVQPEGNLLHAKGTLLLDESSGSQEKKPFESMSLNEMQHESSSVDTSANNKSEKTMKFSSIFDGSISKSSGLENQLYKASSVEEIESASNGEATELDAGRLTRNKSVGGSNKGHSPSILDKLFGSAVMQNDVDSSGSIELSDKKPDVAASPRTVQSSKFAYLFLDEEKKQANMSSSRPNDLLSLFKSREKSGSEISDEKANSSSQFPSHGSGHADGSTAKSATMGSSEQICKINNSKSIDVPSVLTCEDLEQSMLSEINEKRSTSPPRVQGWNVPDMRIEQKQHSIDGTASQHLLSLLQKGTSGKDIVNLPNIETTPLDRTASVEGPSVGNAFRNIVESHVENQVDSGKSLTLETIFGTAFMKELQSVGAPEPGSTEVSDSHGLPRPFTEDDLVPSISSVQSNMSSYGNTVLPRDQREPIKPDSFQEQLFGYNDHQTGVNSSRSRSELRSDHTGYLRTVDVGLPEEDSFITVNDPVNLQNFMSVRGSAKPEPESLNSGFRDERPIMGGQEGLPFLRGPPDMRERNMSFHNLNVQASPPQLQSSQFNQMVPGFHLLESHRGNNNSQMNFMPPEGIARHDSAINHQFSTNMIHPPQHHHSMLQQMHLAGNLPPPHVLQGFPRGAPLPPQSNQLTGFVPEMNPMQGFPFGHRQPNFASHGMPPAPNVGRSDHPEAVQRLIEMELRANAKQIPHFGPGSQNQGAYGHELDMGFRYR